MMEARAMGTAAATTASITAAERKLRRVRSDNIGTSSGSDRKLVPEMLHQNAYAPGELLAVFVQILTGLTEGSGLGFRR